MARHRPEYSEARRLGDQQRCLLGVQGDPVGEVDARQQRRGRVRHWVVPEQSEPTARRYVDQG